MIITEANQLFCEYKRLLYLIVFIIMLYSCSNSAERKVYIGMNPINFDYQLEKII